MAMFDTLKKDTRLTNLAIAFHDPSSAWKQIFNKAMNVESINTWYPVFDEKAYADIDDRANFRKGSKTTPKEVDFEYTDKNITIKGYEAFGFKSKLELSEARAATIDSVEEDLTRGIMRKLNKFVDLDLVDLIASTSTWFNQAITAVWTDQTNGNPELDLRDLRRDIITQSRGNFAPNTIIASNYVWDLLWMHAKIKDRFDHVTGDQDAKKSWFLDMIGITNPVELRITKNTASKGGTATHTSAMGNYLWMGYIDPNPSRTSPTAMAPLVPAEYVGNQDGVAITKIRKIGGDKFEDGKEGVKVFGDQFTEVKQISKDLGKLLTGIHA